jgi:putative redox protein
MKARVKWVNDLTFLGESESGHGIVMDTRPQFGGNNLGPSPMELVLLGVGGCTAIDVVNILKKGRQKIEGCSIDLSAEQAPEPPKVFTRVHVHYVVSGQNLDPKKVDNAIKLSAEKYCSVSLMVATTAEITHDFEIVETAT